jgi:hypothetical protein
MRAMVFDGYGDPDVQYLRNVAVPKVEQGDREITWSAADRKT